MFWLWYPISDLAKPSKEQLALQMELRRLQSARSLDEEEFDNQKQVLQAQLQSEVSRIAASRWVWETKSVYFFFFFPGSLFSPWGMSCVNGVCCFRVTCTYRILYPVCQQYKKSCCFLQVERCAQLKGHLIECEEKSQWMTSHIEDLKMQLRQTQQGTQWLGMHVCHVLVISYFHSCRFQYAVIYVTISNA